MFCSQCLLLYELCLIKTVFYLSHGLRKNSLNSEYFDRHRAQKYIQVLAVYSMLL